jgi:hypothetical protein
MKRSIVIILNILCLIGKAAVAQKKDAIAVADSIQREATMLYRSEMASWYGTDTFLERFKSKQGLIGGYISYDTGKGVNNVFFGKGDDPAVLSTITFNYAFDIKIMHSTHPVVNSLGPKKNCTICAWPQKNLSAPIHCSSITTTPTLT